VNEKYLENFCGEMYKTVHLKNDIGMQCSVALFSRWLCSVAVKVKTGLTCHDLHTVSTEAGGLMPAVLMSMIARSADRQTGDAHQWKIKEGSSFKF
jgi:hypothetical protein